MDIVPETINRIRLSDDELILLENLVKKMDVEKLDENEKEFYNILLGRVQGRIKLKEEGKAK